MKKKAVEWPAGTTLTDEMREYAALHGVDPEVEFESWRDYHVARGNKFANWYATWMTWCRNAEKFKNEKRAQIGFTAAPRLSMQQQMAMKENEEVAQEVASLTPAQRVENLKRLQAIIGSIRK